MAFFKKYDGTKVKFDPVFEYKDLLGNDIKVGDYIAYSAVDGRSGVMRIGQVLELTWTKEGNFYTDLPDPKIRAKSWSNFKARAGVGRQKDVSLTFMDRMIVLSPNTISQKIIDSLNGPI